MPPTLSDGTIVAIDPGVGHCGVAVFKDRKPQTLYLFETEPEKQEKKGPKIYKGFDDYRRCADLMKNLDAVMKKHKPVRAVAELPISGGRNAAAVKYLAMTTAIVAHIEVMYGIDVHGLTPNQVKWYGGSKTSKKGPIIRRALKSFPYLNWPQDKRGNLANPSKLEHCADAIATFFSWEHYRV